MSEWQASADIGGGLDYLHLAERSDQSTSPIGGAVDLRLRGQKRPKIQENGWVLGGSFGVRRALGQDAVPNENITGIDQEDQFENFNRTGLDLSGTVGRTFGSFSIVSDVGGRYSWFDDGHAHLESSPRQRQSVLKSSSSAFIFPHVGYDFGVWSLKAGVDVSVGHVASNDEGSLSVNLAPITSVAFQWPALKGKKKKISRVELDLMDGGDISDRKFVDRTPDPFHLRADQETVEVQLDELQNFKFYYDDSVAGVKAWCGEHRDQGYEVIAYENQDYFTLDFAGHINEENLAEDGLYEVQFAKPGLAVQKVYLKIIPKVQRQRVQPKEEPELKDVLDNEGYD